MSGLKNTVKRFVNASMGKGYKTGREIRTERATKAQGVKDKMFSSAQIPDDEEIKRNERRRQAKRAGSRANTVLTDQDKLG